MIKTTYYAAFFLGLLESRTYIYNYRNQKPYFLIKLPTNAENRRMLDNLNKSLNLFGSVYETSPQKKVHSKVVLRGSSETSVTNLVKLCKSYPPLSKAFIDRLNSFDHVKLSDSSKPYKLYTIPAPFNPHRNVWHCAWLSGFLEGRAYFHLSSVGHGQMVLTAEDRLLEQLKNYFFSKTKLRSRINRKSNLILTGEALAGVLQHIKTYPLLGYQKVVVETFKSSWTPRPRVPMPALKQKFTKFNMKPHEVGLYLKPFLLGLFEGDGSLSLNKTKQGKAYGVFQISLRHTPENHAMLDLLKQTFGGTLSYQKSQPNAKIRWFIVAKPELEAILKIFESYAPLTSRKKCQLRYLKQTLVHRSWDYHLATRDDKYADQKQIIEQHNVDFVIPHYFGAWLSGFMEAEGCFRSSASASLSVYVSQNDDWYILNAIKTYWNSHHKLGKHTDARSKATHYRLSISGKPALQRIIKHFENYPLLGYKRVSYDLFCERFQKKKLKQSN